MISFTKLFAACAIISLTLASGATEVPHQNSAMISATTPITYGQQITFESKLLNSSTSMNIYLPENFKQSSEHHTYPVIFINDIHGSQFFHALTGIVKHLSEVERMPKSIVVSLNDGGHVPALYANGMWGDMKRLDNYGQPKLYLRHLTEEVFPFLQQQYRANNHRTIIGVSGSARFPLYALTQPDKIFDASLFLATSDMIGMGYTQGSSMIDDIEKSLNQRASTKEFLYFADADSDFNHDKAYQLNLKKINTALSANKNEKFTFDIEAFDNEDHYAAFLKAMLSGFEQMYPNKLWAPRYREIIKQPGDAMHNIDQFYHELSKVYGFKILPNADRWNNVNNLRYISGKLIRDGRAKEAITLAQRWFLYQPQSSAALFTWAQALEKSALNQQAHDKYEQLISLATKQKSERLAEFKLALLNLQKAMP